MWQQQSQWISTVQVGNVSAISMANGKSDFNNYNHLSKPGLCSTGTRDKGLQRLSSRVNMCWQLVTPTVARWQTVTGCWVARDWQTVTAWWVARDWQTVTGWWVARSNHCGSSVTGWWQAGGSW